MTLYLTDKYKCYNIYKQNIYTIKNYIDIKLISIEKEINIFIRYKTIH
jgi:hypothetical protein